MDKVKKYQSIIEAFMQKHNGFPTSDFPTIKDVPIINKDENQFIQITMGWKGYEYIHHVSFHLEIKKDGKVWIHENRTDILIENELIEAGIEAKDIIAGMIEPLDENAKAA